MRVLVTGAMGSVGQPLVHDLRVQGHEVLVLVRFNRRRTSETVYKILGPVEILEGDILQDMCGVTAARIAQLHNVDVCIACAGKTKYEEEDTYIANTLGTYNTLALCETLGARFVYISTCYVVGALTRLDEHTYLEREVGRNWYEISKIEAELRVKLARNALVVRLATVIGDIQTGEIVGIGGLSGFVGALWAHHAKIKKYPNNPLLLRYFNPYSTLNMVTSGWTARQICNAAFSELTGIVHLAHPLPVGLGWLFQRTFGEGQFELPLTHDVTRWQETMLPQDPGWVAAQEAVDTAAYIFRLYVAQEAVFDTTRAQTIPGYVPHPPITEEIIKTQLDFMARFFCTRR